MQTSSAGSPSGVQYCEERLNAGQCVGAGVRESGRASGRRRTHVVEVAVRIDQARRDELPRGFVRLERRVLLPQVGAHGYDEPARHRHVRDLIDAVGGVDDAAAVDEQVDGRQRRGGRRGVRHVLLHAPEALHRAATAARLAAACAGYSSAFAERAGYSSASSVGDATGSRST